MKVLVTGGAGFLGLHLARKMASGKNKILLFDIAEFDKSEYLRGTEFYYGDVRDSKLLNSIMPKVDIVIHTAAALPLWSRKEIFSVNVKGTRCVLDTAIRNKVERVIVISSTAVYGIPERHPIYEDDRLRGVGPYGESKVLAEKVCQDYRDKGLCVPILRPKTFIGTERLGVFQILCDWVKQGKRIPMVGDGNNEYQLFDVEDLVDAIIFLMKTSESRANNTFNVGAKEFGTIRESIEALCIYAGNGARPLAIPASIAKAALRLFEKLKLSPLYEWVYNTIDKESFVSIEKIEKLGWAPKYSNADALIKMYDWYVAQYKNIQTGVTHRSAWNQGILKLFRHFL